jgi:hypothetical protein
MYPTQMRQSEGTAARRRIPIWLVDATDGLAAETGVTGTPRISKNGAASAAATASITQVDITNMPGLYYLELTAGELDTLGHVLVSFKTAATAQWHGTVQVVDYDPYDTVRMGLTALPNAAAEAAGGLYTRGTGAGQINQPANGQVDANVAAMAASILTAAALAADAVDEIVDQVWEEDATDHQTQGSFGQAIGDPVADASTIWGLANTNLDAAVSTRSSHGDPDPSNFLDVAVSSRAIAGDAMDLVANAVDTASVATGAIDADALATDAVNEIRDAILTGTNLSELSAGIPAATPSLSAAIMLLYMALRNHYTQTSTLASVRNDADAVITKATISDDGTTFSREEFVAGP